MELPAASRTSPPGASGRAPLLAYALAVALWSGANGMQAVLFSWLVVGELHAPARQVGLVQMALLLPVLALLLPGGATADRVDRRRLMLALHGVAGLLALALGVLVATGALSLALLVGYALAMGSVTAFLLPARDSLLTDVAQGDLMRAATVLTLAQFGAQAAGTLLAGSARFAGVGPVLGLQALVLLGGIAAVRRLPRTRPDAGPARPELRPGELLTGLTEVARSPVMRSTMLLMSGVGLFLAGAYFVMVPILIRDHYRGDVAELSLFMGALQAGTVLGAAGLLGARGFARRGRALAASLGATALPMLGLAAGVPFAAALALGFLWGLCVAAFQSLGRAIVQEAAPEAHRARVLSVFSLGVMGAGVLGQPLSGLLAEAVGPGPALGWAGAALLCFVLAVAAGTGVTRVR